MLAVIHPVAGDPSALPTVTVRELASVRPLVTRLVSASAQKSYTIAAGDTLSGIAGRLCGSPDKWSVIYGQNQSKIKNPDMVYPGQQLTFTCDGPSVVPQGYYARRSAPVVSEDIQSAQRSTAAVAAVTGASGVVGGTYYGSGAMQQCIISRESGGNSQVMNGSGHYGLYQFSESTWAAHGGNPADFGHASVAEQNQVYANTVAADGYSDWSPYDGCTP